MSDPAAIVLISTDGMLGRAFAQHLGDLGRAFTGATIETCDITDVGQVEHLIGERAQLVINCSAFTDVDGAESHEEAAIRVNGRGVSNLAARCACVGATLMHFSTDYVFDGHATSPYPVDAPHAPLNAYGRSKAVGETAIWNSGCPHLVIRTSWLYAPWGNNFVRTMAKLTRDRDELRVVDDQRGRPTSAEYLATKCMQLFDVGATGNFHVTDSGECTWHGFAVEIAKQLKHACEIAPCSSDEFLRPAKRPPYSVLSLAELEQVLGTGQPWQENLADVLKRLEPV